ncbi:MAG: hypothetical protein GF403_07475 [Candidatus Coatesbacteria bacterium]|nr:hypothetical protein [Candidatus Coatesbacteria bacterium]
MSEARFAALKAQKLFEKKLERLREEVELWRDRLNKAENAGRTELVSAARTKLDELREDEAMLRHKLAEAQRLVAEIDTEVPPELTPTDRAEMLQKSLDELVGEDADTLQELDDAALEQAAAEELERLKEGGAADDDLADL